MTVTTSKQSSKKALDWTAAVGEIGPRFAERAARHDEDDSFVASNFADLAELRFFSAAVPTELGGGGASHSQICSAVRRIAHDCPSTALAMSMHQHLLAAALWRWRRGQDEEAFLRRVAQQQLVLVSTGATDWVNSEGEMTKVDGGYRVSALKRFASGAPGGDLLVTSARYDDPERGPRVLHFAVPMNSEGVSVGSDWRTLGMRGTGSNAVTLDSVFVPDQAIGLDRQGGVWHTVWNVVIVVAMPLIMSAYVGIAEQAAQIARTRASGGSKAAHYTPYLLGEMENSLTATQVTVDSMIAIANNHEFAPTIENADAVLKRKTLAARVGDRNGRKGNGGGGRCRLLPGLRARASSSGRQGVSVPPSGREETASLQWTAGVWGSILSETSCDNRTLVCSCGKGDSEAASLAQHSHRADSGT